MSSSELSRLPLFEKLPPEAVDAIQSHSELKNFPDQAALCLEGQPVDAFHIILDGTVEVVKALGSNEEHQIAVRSAGDTLGELNLFTPDQIRSASVRALGEVRALSIALRDMEHLIRQFPQIGFQLFSEISQRMRESENHLIQHLRRRNKILQETLIELQAAQEQVIAKEKLEHELSVARQIQQNLLPKQTPAIPGWQINAAWEPARAVSGDFYDFVFFPDGHMGLLVGDVTGKGVPAALVMATTRSVLRAVTGAVESTHKASPGEILNQVNRILCQDMPAFMFVTCLLGIIDLQEGTFAFANAGHVLPIKISGRDLTELRATGLPLGVYPDQVYDTVSTKLESGESLFFLSDGLVEAHNAEGEMYGSARLKQQLTRQSHSASIDGKVLITHLLRELHAFTGEGWEQEDDLTFVILSKL